MVNVTPVDVLPERSDGVCELAVAATTSSAKIAAGFFITSTSYAEDFPKLRP
jgi:hypothetical protein